MVDLQTIIQAVYYGSLISVLSVGVTLSYMTTRVFNFAQVRFAMVSGYLVAALIVYLIVALDIGFDKAGYFAYMAGKASTFVPLPYWMYILSLVLAALIGGGVAVLQYKLVLKPLERRGASGTALMISTLGFDFILISALFLFATLPAIQTYAEEAKIKMDRAINPDFTSLKLDNLDPLIRIGGVDVKFSVLLAVVLAVATTIGLWLMLRGTTLGVMMRSSIENKNLALVLGIDVDRVFAITWFIAGAIAGLAGYLFIFAATYLKPMTPTTPSDEIVVSVFAGSIVGGVNSVAGSIGGGFLIGIIEKLVVPILQTTTGLDLVKYDKVFSMLAVGITLLFIPQGLASLFSPERMKRLGLKRVGGE